MKFAALTLFLFTLLPGRGVPQSTANGSLAQLQRLLQQTTPNPTTQVGTLDRQYAVQIDDHVFPLAETTQVRWEKQAGKHQVEFFLQQGTAVTSVNDPTFRRAYWSIGLSSKRACREFIHLFGRLRIELQKSVAK